MFRKSNKKESRQRCGDTEEILLSGLILNYD